MAKIGRPKIEIDFKLLDNLCGIQCTEQEISDVMGISVDTLERRVIEETGIAFAEYYRAKKGKGKMSLRRMMWTAAGRGDRVMQIWLSKQHLGMADKQELTGKDGEDLIFTINLIGGNGDDKHRLENQ